MTNKAEMRTRLRRARRSLSERERRIADERICRNLQHARVFQRARTVAAYNAFDGEPSLTRLLDDSRNAAKQFLVPVIQPQRMTFAPARSAGGLRANKLGIAEPNHRQRVLTSDIDVVLVPLVGFDVAGNRLGMGGGYYDRHFAYLRERRYFRQPRLIGVAYEVQCVAAIPTEPWDVPLWGIVTEHRMLII